MIQDDASQAKASAEVLEPWFMLGGMKLGAREFR
jgi:hypothetical protein